MRVCLCVCVCVCVERESEREREGERERERRKRKCVNMCLHRMLKLEEVVLISRSKKLNKSNSLVPLNGCQVLEQRAYLRLLFVGARGGD